MLRIFLSMKGSQPGSGLPQSFWCLINVLFAEYANVNKCIKKTYCNLPPAKAWKDQNIYFVGNNEIKSKDRSTTPLYMLIYASFHWRLENNPNES